MAQINKQWSTRRDRLFAQFVKDARDLVPKLPCCTCEAGASWRENEGESLVIDLVTLYGRKFDVRLPVLDCSGCGAARPFAAVELGCFPLNPSSASPTARKVIVSSLTAALISHFRSLYALSHVLACKLVVQVLPITLLLLRIIVTKMALSIPCCQRLHVESESQ